MKNEEVKNEEVKNEEVKKIKVNLLRDVTFPDGVKTKGETVETDQSTADWLIKVGATEHINEVKRGKNSKRDTADNH